MAGFWRQGKQTWSRPHPEGNQWGKLSARKAQFCWQAAHAAKLARKTAGQAMDLVYSYHTEVCFLLLSWRLLALPEQANTGGS